LTGEENYGKLINVAATGKREPAGQRQRKIKKLLTTKGDCDKISPVAKTTHSFEEQLRKNKIKKFLTNTKEFDKI
jgi:hypothetical protein